MTLVLDATPGGAASNSYVDETTAAAYFAGRLGADAWDSATEPDRQKALVTATARLEQELWTGRLTSITQRLRWPRAFVQSPDPFVGAPPSQVYGTSYGIYYYDAGVIPRPIQEACAELALFLLQEQGEDSDVDPLAPTGLEGVESLAVTGLSITPAKSGQADSALPPHVARMLRGFLMASQTRVIRA